MTMAAPPSPPATPPALDAATPRPAAAKAESQWSLIGRRFMHHKVAVASLYVLIAMMLMAVFAEVVAPYPKYWSDLSHTYCPPQPPRFSFGEGFYVYGVSRHVDPITLKRDYVIDPDDIVPLGFFVEGEPYKLGGLIPWNRHLFGVDRVAYRQQAGALEGEAVREPVFFMLGGDRYGRDLLSRIVYGARVSLSVGLVGIALTFVLGLAIGGLSGYVGGPLDNLVQRGIEVIQAFPRLPLWLALAALMPRDWSALKIYFGITVVLSILGWTGLARVVRGKLLSLREEDYAVAARLLGASHSRIIFRHLLPGFTSHIIVALTLSVPGMILGETSLSFLGLGLRPPVVSWGVLLQDCMNMQVVATYPWLLLPVLLIILTVLAFNFLGDGLRDAADPYAMR